MADLAKKTEISPIESVPQERFRSGSISKDVVEKGDLANLNAVPEMQYGGFTAEERPPLDYSSFGAFLSSSWKRFKSLWTRRFIYALLAGQLVSLCITCTNVTTTELVKRGFSNPTTQTFFLYFTICIVYTPYTMYQYGMKGWANMVLRDGWKCSLLPQLLDGNSRVGHHVQISSWRHAMWKEIS
jgi:solute carrier family 35, member F1/2